MSTTARPPALMQGVTIAAGIAVVGCYLAALLSPPPHDPFLMHSFLIILIALA
ncbi:MAG: hypothetical protein HYZ94_03450, partial [Candidatus Omnitrophica bacterium]|nr:hypothetical protein [Candidatus Omnitrophota bacterium]